jgi:glyoxylase-like metal-dependent hydrolase (beta-lactamase superfamily II)
MAYLQAAVHVAAPIVAQLPDRSGPSGVWSPISCTLIYSEKEAVLVDTPITIRQTRELISWIEEIAPNRKLCYIYITHGHGDHWFGLPQLIQRWPEAVPVATAGTITHMHENASPALYHAFWESRFPQQIYQPFTFAQPLPENGKFVLESKWIMQAIECGHTDTHSSTVLWVPDLRLVAGGDVIYGGCHQMLAFANTQALRDEWIRGVEKVESLNPMYVVPGHKKADEIDGVWHLAATKKYIEDFGALWAKNPQTPQEVIDAMMTIYPDRFNNSALRSSVQATFQVWKSGKI